MSSRKQAQNRVKALPVTVTIDRELLEWIETRVSSRIASSRSHAVNQALGFMKWALENNPELFYGPIRSNSQLPQQPRQPQRDTNRY
jgi:hypothetical protein